MAVIDFGGLRAVGESVAKPLDYYDNNLVGTVRMLQAMPGVLLVRHRVRRLAAPAADRGTPAVHHQPLRTDHAAH